MDKRVLLVCLVAGVAGCGGGGGGGGGRTSSGSTAVGPIGSASYVPKAVTRAASYSWQSVSSPVGVNGGTFSAAAVAAGTTSMFTGLAPLGRVDLIDGQGPQSEVSFVFDVSSFAVVGSDVYAATGNANASRAGQVFKRDGATSLWALSLNGNQRESVVAELGGAVYAFQGSANESGTVSVISSGSWVDIAQLASAVPTAACSSQGELFVGARSSGTDGKVFVFRGAGSSFKATALPITASFNQVASVSAIGAANGSVFVGVEIKDSITGETISGQLFVLDTKGPVALASYSKDAPSALVALDGTIYVGTRAGKIQWLDEKGKWNDEASLTGATGLSLLLDNNLFLHAGVRTATGPQLRVRVGSSAPVAPTTPTPSGMTITAITPAMGPIAGGTDVTIVGTGFADVTAVTLGGKALTALVVAPTEIRGKTAASTAGAVDLQIVSSTKGTATKTGAFTYQGPTVPSLSYATDVLPILNANCTVCHKAGGAASFSALTPYSSIMQGRSSGLNYVQPGDPTKSWLIWKTDASQGGNNATMTSHLTAAQATILKNWILGGAKP